MLTSVRSMGDATSALVERIDGIGYDDPMKCECGGSFVLGSELRGCMFDLERS
jgi:hypothetical protein